MDECTIPRGLFMSLTSTLHVFCDAIKHAFGSCIYMRNETTEFVKVNLVLGKARVAATKPLTLSCLELMAALLDVRLCKLAFAMFR